VLKEFQIHPWSKEIEWEIENTLKEMKSEMRLKYPILGEVKPLKNRGIPRRNQEIATKGSRSLSTVCSWELGENESEGVSFAPVRVKTAETGYSGFQNRTIRFWLNQAEMPFWDSNLF
jgi:hypothetical protein